MDPRSDMASASGYDDATGRITGGWFDTQETLNGYYHVFHQILTTYGIPYVLWQTAVLFSPIKKNSPSIDEDTYTVCSCL